MKKMLALWMVAGLAVMGSLALGHSPAMALDPYDTPLVSCGTSGMFELSLKVCGGPNTGAPAGITVQYKKASDYAVSGWADDGTLCAISLSGQPSLMHPDKSRWELLPGECEEILLGDVNFDETGVSGNECAYGPLECGTDYVIRVFAHAGRRMGRSDWSANLTCSTLPCETGCTLTQGYWQAHGPGDCHKGQNANTWPVSSLMLGTTKIYTAAELCSILNKPAGGNGLISLAHQLITAKFNVAAGASSGCIATTIAAADALIGNLVVPPVGSGFLAPSSTSTLVAALDDYNNGRECVGHCDGARQPGVFGSSNGRRSTWGNVKVIYR